IERFANLPDSAHRMMNPATAEPGLGDDKTAAPGTEQMVFRDLHVTVAQIAVSTFRFFADANIAHEFETRSIDGHDEGGEALIRSGVRVRDCHRNQERGVAGIGGEPLLAINYPVITTQLRFGLKNFGVGAAWRSVIRKQG